MDDEFFDFICGVSSNSELYERILSLINFIRSQMIPIQYIPRIRERLDRLMSKYIMDNLSINNKNMNSQIFMFEDNITNNE